MADDPGWAVADDGCQAVYGFLGWRCEGEADHSDRGEAHTFTVAWFDPVAEPDCEECADTGQVGGRFCDCAAGKRLAGPTQDPIVEAGNSTETGGRWIVDEDE